MCMPEDVLSTDIELWFWCAYGDWYDNIMNILNYENMKICLTVCYIQSV